MADDRTQALKALLAEVAAGKLSRPLPFPAYQCAYLIGAFNGSLDAAKALHEAVLPRHRVDLDMITGTVEVWREIVSDDGTGTDEWVWLEDAHIESDPARAWLIAILRALIALDT